MLNADAYSKNKEVQKKDAEFLLDNYFRLIKLRPQGDDKILDVGSGDGEIFVDIIFEKFPKMCQHLTGSDISSEMVEYANKKYAHCENVSFITLDIATSRLPNELEQRFDHVFSFYCLHWVQNQMQAMNNIYNLLKPGGDMFVALLVGKNPVFTIYQQLQRNPKWSDYMKDVANFISPYFNNKNSARDFENLMRKCGFSVPVCVVYERAFTFENIEYLKKSAFAICGFLNRIPKDKRDEYINDYMDIAENIKFIEQNNNEESCSVTYELLVAVGVKPECEFIKPN